MNFWEWITQAGLIQGDPNYYASGQASDAEVRNALQVAVNNLQFASDPGFRAQFWQELVEMGAIQGDPSFYSTGQATAAEVQNAVNTAGDFFIGSPSVEVTPGQTATGTVRTGSITDVSPVSIGNTTIPQGARLVIVRDPEGSDADRLYNLVYEWRGVELAFEVGDRARFEELFGAVDNFSQVSTVSQGAFDDEGFVGAGSVDEILGSSESLGSQIEREVRALGLEDLPNWLAASSESLALVAEATSSGWSSGRLWQELSGTQAFTDRFGGALDRYLQGGTTIQQAVSQLQADEQNLRRRLQFLAPPDSLTTDTLQAMLSQGWTPDSAARVMEQASILSNTGALAQANQIMEASGLPSLDDVGFINALNGFGPPEIVEALNTVAASVALEEAGLDDVDIDLLMDVVDTSDRLLTVESFQELTQELSFNFARFGAEFGREKLGLERDDVVAALFGEESPTGRTPGEVLNLLARFERDRRAAAEGISGPSAGIDRRGRLVVQGLEGL